MERINTNLFSVIVSKTFGYCRHHMVRCAYTLQENLGKKCTLENKRENNLPVVSLLRRYLASSFCFLSHVLGSSGVKMQHVPLAHPTAPTC